jgi:hypothetical protein
MFGVAWCSAGLKAGAWRPACGGFGLDPVRSPGFWTSKRSARCAARRPREGALMRRPERAGARFHRARFYHVNKPDQLCRERPATHRLSAAPLAAQAAFRPRFGGRAGFAGSGGSAFSSKSSASFSVIAPPSSSASTIVTARL